MDQGWPFPDQKRRGVHDFSLEIYRRRVSALTLDHGEASAQTIGVPWRPPVALEFFGRICCHPVS
jgi:hypothetical protein